MSRLSVPARVAFAHEQGKAEWGKIAVYSSEEPVLSWSREDAPMKVVLLDNQDDVVACLQYPEEFDPRSASNLFTLLDFLETALQGRKKNGSGIRRPSNCDCVPAASQPLLG